MDAALEHAAATAPEAGIKYVEQGCCTFESYAALISEARKMTHALRALGIAVGEPIALQITEYARTSVLQPRASRRATAASGCRRRPPSKGRDATSTAAVILGLAVGERSMANGDRSRG